jgi:flagellar motor switch protein FliG
MNSNDIKIDGKKEAAALLASLDSESRERILSGIRKSDPTLADTLQKGLYRFEQVFHLDWPELQKVIQTLPSRLLAISMRGLSDELKTLLSTKLSRRQMQLLEDEIENVGPQRTSDVKQAQEKIAAHAGQMHEQGLIHLI